MNDAEQIGWAIGPLPVAITFVSLFFLVRLLLKPTAFNRQYEYCAFGIAPGLVAAAFFVAGVRDQSDITPVIQTLATIVGVAVTLLLLAAIRIRGGVEVFAPAGNDPPPLFILVGGYLLFLVLFISWIALFHVWVANIEPVSCNWRCRAGVRLLGSPTSAFSLIWGYTFFSGFVGTGPVIGAVQLARRLKSGSRSWWV